MGIPRSRFRELAGGKFVEEVMMIYIKIHGHSYIVHSVSEQRAAQHVSESRLFDRRAGTS